MITEDYVSFEIAKLLKEKGFDKDWVNGSIEKYLNGTEGYSLPTLAMVMKWFREVHNKFIEICTDRAHNFKDIVFRPAIYDKELDCLWESDNFSTYEQACETAIKYCLENLI